MGTVVNIQTGARTALSGLARAGILLVVVLGAAQLTQTIPMAVLAGIAFKVGIDILDWSFLQRAHKVSVRGTIIMYGVLFLTVFVDLIAAVGVGVFIANILTIDRLSELQAQGVKVVSDSDDDIPLSPEEQEWLDQGMGKVLLFYLSGPMIFGVSKAIAREHAALQDSHAVIFDLSDVSHMGVTVSLAIENMIQDALDMGCQVYVVGANKKIQNRLESMGLAALLPSNHWLIDRKDALQRAVRGVQSKMPTPIRPELPPPIPSETI